MSDRPASDEVGKPEKSDADDTRASEKRPVKVAKRSSRTQVKVAEINESQIRAPDTQTLVMLSLVAAVTLIMWAAGRAACNLHPPRETKRPREVTLQDLASTPKDAALELALRWGKKDYTGALQLAGGNLTGLLKKAKAKCDKDAQACATQRADLKDKVEGVATVLTRAPTTALVQVSLRGATEPEPVYRLAMTRQGRTWRGDALMPGGASLAPANKPTGKGGASGVGGAMAGGIAGHAPVKMHGAGGAGATHQPMLPGKRIAPPPKPVPNPPPKPPAPPPRPPASQ